MFSYLRGTILGIDEQRITLLAEGTGIGFEIFVSIPTLSRIKLNEPAEFFIHHHITDVSETLFAFPSLTEKALFRQLMKVDGVGGKTAISLLSLGASGLVEAINTGDEKMISSVPGIGKKTALKIILELKDKVTRDDIIKNNTQPTLTRTGDLDIIDTLVGMGYDRKRVDKVIAAIPTDLETIQERVVYAIKAMSEK
jgi:Holliday junction DNA helicase RuvA